MPHIRRSVPLVVLAVFVAGAGIGALIIALTDQGGPRKIVVKHVARTAPAPAPTRAHARKRQSTPKPSHPHPAPVGDGILSAASANDFNGLAGGLPGQVGLAVAPLGQGPVHTLGALKAGHAWSTMKVPVLVTLLRDYQRSGRTLSPQERQDAALALEQSDNAAAEALFAVLERIHGGLVPASQAVQRTLADAGDPGTVVNTAPNDLGFTTWGQTLWSTRAEVVFYRSLAQGCLLAPADNAYVLGLMRNVIPEQRWGAGAAGYSPSVPLAFKAGWGPGNTGGYLVRQTAIVGSGDHGYVVSVIALPSSGSFSDGVSMVTALATWAREHVRDVAAPPATCSRTP